MDETRLGAWIAAHLGAPDLTVEESRPLGGGSIQENRLIRCRIGEGIREFVLRRDAPATIASSRSRREEFRLLEAAHQADLGVAINFPALDPTPHDASTASTEGASANPVGDDEQP